jgi:hypothetical protein
MFDGSLWNMFQWDKVYMKYWGNLLQMSLAGMQRK